MVHVWSTHHLNAAPAASTVYCALMRRLVAPCSVNIFQIRQFWLSRVICPTTIGSVQVLYTNDRDLSPINDTVVVRFLSSVT